MLMAVSDHELMRRLQSGDLNAFEDLVGRWQAPLGRILGHLSNSTANGVTGSATPEMDCDDLAQEVFLKIYRGRKRYRPEAEFSTWLYRIAVNVARDAARRRRRRPDFSANGRDHSTEQQTHLTQLPDKAAEAVERKQIVNAALQCLPARLREPLVLRHYSQLTFPQISDVLKVPCTTIKSRVLQALKQLEQEIRRLGIDETEVES